MGYEVKYKPRELEKDLGAPLEFFQSDEIDELVLQRTEQRRKKRAEKKEDELLKKFSYEGGANLENVAEEYGMPVHEVLANIGDCVKMEVISSEKIKIKKRK